MKIARYGIVGILLSLMACQSSGQEHAAEVHVELGLAFLNQGQRPRAKHEFLRALALSPKLVSANGAMAYYSEQVGDDGQARAYYLNAIALAPGAGGPLNNYGAFLCRQGNYRQADSLFARAVLDAHYENTAVAFENAGLCALKRHDSRQAETYFTRALAYDPSKKISREALKKLRRGMYEYK